MLPIQDVGKGASQAQVGGWELAAFEEQHKLLYINLQDKLLKRTYPSETLNLRERVYFLIILKN